jgi:hypothetical protein
LAVRLFSAENIELGNVKETAITIPTLELSVDMLRQTIYKDKNVIRALGLLDNNEKLELSRLQIGKMENGLFSAYSSIESLNEVGLNDKDTVWVYCCKF